MRLHVINDLHIEFEPLEIPKVDADVTVIAGDIAPGLNGMEWIRNQLPDRPVIYVAGNHEFYGQVLQKEIRELKSISNGTNVHFLEDDWVTLGNVTFIGATLWTDLQLFGDPVRSAAVLKLGMTDYQHIRTEPRYSQLRPADTRRLHLSSRRYIERECSKRVGDKLVIVTHHAPSARSVHPTFATDPLTAAYASHLDALVEASGARLWVHGHIHRPSDYRIGSTRVITNPRGYPNEREVTGFDPALVVEA